MLIPLLCSLVLNTPVVALPEAPAQTAWNGMVSRYSGAQALEFKANFLMAGDDQPYDIEIHLTKGMRGTVAMVRGEERIDFVADGKGLYALNHGQETYMKIPEGYIAVPIVGYLGALQTWAGAPASEPTKLTLLEQQPPNPLVQVLQAEFPGRTEILWLNPQQRLLAASLKIDMGEFKINAHVTFARAEALTEFQSEDYAAKLPESYSEISGTHELLLPPGTPAPDVEFWTMDGKTLRLDDLLGKTVLLNFWFYT